ncbi:MAG: hypothetical protein ABI947_09570 [Chloroflexota bacterium]
MLRRSSILLMLVSITAILFGALAYTPAQADEATAWAINVNNLRSGPARKFAVLSTLQPNTEVVLEARTNDTSWILVHTKDGANRGWGATPLFKLAPTVKLYSLPVSTEEVGPGSKPGDAPPASGQPVDPSKLPVYQLPVPPLPNDIPSGAIRAPILPVITPRIRSYMRTVVEKGKTLGNNLRVFSKVGDCHTDHPLFFNGIGNGVYNLGKYSSLKEIIDYYSVSPRPGAGNSFNTASKAAHSAYSSGAVLDWQLADPGVCQQEETPLRCEYRLSKPAVAIIMFGVVDVMVMTPQQFNLHMRIIVRDSMDHGVVPILSTAAENASDPAKARLFNQIVVKVAQEMSVPLINLQGALAPLPNKGLDADGIHLSRTADLDQAAVFNDTNLQYGYTMRNLVTLEALQLVYHQILN